MKYFSSSQLIKIAEYFDAAKDQIFLYIKNLDEELAEFNLNTRPTRFLLNQLSNMQFVEEWLDFSNNYDELKKDFPKIINLIFSIIDIEQDINLYRIYSNYYHVDVLITMLDLWNKIAFDNLKINKDPLTLNEISKMIRKNIWIDLSEFQQLAANFNFQNKKENKLIKQIIKIYNLQSIENAMLVLIQLFEQNHPMTFKNLYSREEQSMILAAYYLLIKQFTLISFVNYWANKKPLNINYSSYINDLIRDDELHGLNVVLSTDDLNSLKRYLELYKNKTIV
ncbi:hypothetical protein [Spiroplasma endosymbiont of Labia minor]|uniref:hypothetical protein n=1 Tax=Spiroplasma endosymbiont of Labia minor TaxID=3066305 RepID=UPI0030D3C755